jgi:hypothetical protein
MFFKFYKFTPSMGTIGNTNSIFLIDSKTKYMAENLRMGSLEGLATTFFTHLNVMHFGMKKFIVESNPKKNLDVSKSKSCESHGTRGCNCLWFMFKIL